MSPILTLSPRRNRVLLWLAAALFVGGMIWAAREVLLPYLLGLILAYLLLPVVNGLDRRMPARLRGWHVARPLAIVLTYLLLLILVAGILAFFVPLMAGQISALIDRWPELASRVEDWGTRGWGWYQNHIPADWRQTIEANLTGLINDLIKALQNGLVATARRLFSTISFVIGLVVIPFWLFYILQDESQVKEGVIRVLPLPAPGRSGVHGQAD
jgi:Predicted permease